MLAWCTIFFLLLCSIEAQGGKGLATLATSRPRNTGRQSHPRLQLSNYQTVILSKLQHPSVPPYLFILRVSPKAQASAFKSFHLLLSLLGDWEFWRLGGLNMLYSYGYCYFPQRRRGTETCVVTRRAKVGR